ncbi:hypothetical protein SLEP1_g40537 [Rubroshorea leprosula]|uniref:Secoisolariciresinol dehydrogenase n=1 Tax=Rubroshorea leprosula TaxID=152421 RepID=A0AAV5L3W1_9ROSI|nr:hypothetical protein SLEP1_g40537 [Rubroshorea leprosula]
MSPSSIGQRLLGKVAVITGGASGIGESTARLFVKHGAKVLVADIQDELGHSVCKELGTHETITYAHCDVASEFDVQNTVDLAVSKFGKLDVMFNNAAIPGKLEIKAVDCDIENFKKVFDVNVCGAFLGAKHAARVMIPAKKGCILFTSSLASMICANTPHAYTTSKHAIAGLTRNLSVELGQYGIRVNCISPHVVPTPNFKKTTGITDEKKIDEAVCESAVLKEAKLEAKDIAEAALYLASDESKYVSGVNLAVDGGYRLTNPALAVAFNNMIPWVSCTH